MCVPAIIKWPSRILEARTTNIPAVISAIYPTLLDIAGVELKEQTVLDGISLIPLIEGEWEERPQANMENCLLPRWKFSGNWVHGMM